MSSVATVTVLASAVGPVHAAVADDGVVGIELRTTLAAFERAVGSRLGGPVERADTDTGWLRRRWLDELSDELGSYLLGRAVSFGVPVRLSGVGSWDQRVLEAVRRIPYGAVTSYGRLATAIGARGAARAVGGAVGRNPIGLLIPCHRVIAGDGSLGGYGGSWAADRESLLALKRELLDHEGVSLPPDRFVVP